MTARSPAVLTIGYEGRDLSEVVRLVRDSGARTLLDVRWRPQSRKRGLSKTPLGAALGQAGVSYRHDRRLGTPPDILAEAHRPGGRYDWAAYAGFLEQQGEALEEAALLAGDGPVILMCYEAHPLECHRRLVAARVAACWDSGVVHL